MMSSSAPCKRTAELSPLQRGGISKNRLLRGSAVSITALGHCAVYYKAKLGWKLSSVLWCLNYHKKPKSLLKCNFSMLVNNSCYKCLLFLSQLISSRNQALNFVRKMCAHFYSQYLDTCFLMYHLPSAARMPRFLYALAYITYITECQLPAR